MPKAGPEADNPPMAGWWLQAAWCFAMQTCTIYAAAFGATPSRNRPQSTSSRLCFFISSEVLLWGVQDTTGLREGWETTSILLSWCSLLVTGKWLFYLESSEAICWGPWSTSSFSSCWIFEWECQWVSKWGCRGREQYPYPPWGSWTELREAALVDIGNTDMSSLYGLHFVLGPGEHWIYRGLSSLTVNKCSLLKKNFKKFLKIRK